MTRIAKGTFEIARWDEKPYSEMAGAPKLTRASVTKTYKGEIEGEGQVEYLMAYTPDGAASFVGIEHFTGRVGDRHGQLVLQHVGTFRDGAARSTWTVVPGSGTGALQGMRGEVVSSLGHATSYPVELEYELG